MAMAMAYFFSSYSSLFNFLRCFKSCAINFRQLLSGILNSIHLPSLSFPSSPTGKVERFGGLDSYITDPPESKLAVLMASDVYGYTLIADKAGARGFFTLVPDFFGGDPYTNSTVEPVDQWKQRHPQDIGVEDAKFVIQALKQMGITKIGAVGFCWGGKVAVDLTKAPSVEVGVLLHPTETNVSDIRGVKVPVAILGGKLDTLTPPRLIKKFKATLLKKTKPKVKS